MITGEAVQIEESRSHLRNDLAAAVYQPAASHYMSVHIALDSHICWCKLHHENYIAVLELSRGCFTPWTHEVVPCQRAFSHGHTFHGLISKECIFSSCGSLTRCKPNVDQEK
jgi:hypothetical protein